MSIRVAVVFILTTPILAAQEPEPDFVATYSFVTAPVTVRDQKGRIVHGLSAQDFQLFDKGVPQKVTEDDVSHPISMVVAIQASANMEKLLPGIRKLGNLIDQLVLGEDGELAVLAFDHRVAIQTGFTSDPDQIAGALQKIKSGSGTSHLNDAALNAVHLLRSRPPDRRRILLLIAETRDNGSEVTVRDVMIDAGFANVVVYAVEVSRLMTSLTSKSEPPRPSPIPPEARQLPGGTIGSLTTEAQGQMGNYAPVFKKLKEAVNGVIGSNPQEIYTRATGGREYSYMTQKTLEQAILDLGEEIHGQYLLTYLPSNRDEIGQHDIEVRVSKPGLVLRTRTTYTVSP